MTGSPAREDGHAGCHGRSLSGLRTAQMRVIRSSPATSNANTVSILPPDSTTRPGSPFTVRSRIVRGGANRAIVR